MSKSLGLGEMLLFSSDLDPSCLYMVLGGLRINVTVAMLLRPVSFVSAHLTKS